MAARRVETVQGPIEIDRAGSGDPVLVVHGTPGGCDSGLIMGRFLVAAGFEVIAPSRPGYLGTPLEARESPDAQADLLDCALEVLGLGPVGVFCWSGGGPSAYRLAARHPRRVAALVAAAAVSKPIAESVALTERLVMRTPPGNALLRALARIAPAQTISATLKAEGDLEKEEIAALTKAVLADEEMKETVLGLARVVADYGPRKQGVRSDWHWFAHADELGLEQIEAPALLIQGDADIDVTPDHTAHSAALIAGAETLELARGTHLALWAHPDAMRAQERVIAQIRAGFERRRG